MSTSRTAGSAPAPTRGGIASAAVAPPASPPYGRPAAVPVSSEGVAEPRITLAPLEPAALYRQVARRVARAFLLLVARVVLLVDDDQARAAASRRTPPCRVPSTMRARRRCAASQLAQPLRGWSCPLCSETSRIGAGSARCEAGFQLRRQVDLGHQHQRLGLGRAREQCRPRCAGRPRSCRCRCCRTAGRRPALAPRCAASACRPCALGRDRSAAPASAARGRPAAPGAASRRASCAALQFAQLRRQGGQRDLAQSERW